MIEEREFKVGDITYRIQELLASDRWKLMMEVGKMTGGVFNGIGLDDEINYGLAFMGLMQNATPDQVSDFMKRTLKQSIVQPNISKDEKYEIHFGEYFDHSIDVISEIIELNFGKAIQKLKKKLIELGVFIPIPDQDTEKGKKKKAKN